MRLILTDTEIEELLELLNEDSYLFKKINYQILHKNKSTKKATESRTIKAQAKIKKAIIELVAENGKLDTNTIWKKAGSTTYGTVNKYKDKYIKEVLGMRI